MKRILLAFLFVGIFLDCHYAFAASVPKVWVASETIKAADLNANFSALLNAAVNHSDLEELNFTDAAHEGFAGQNGTNTQQFEAQRFYASGTQVAPIIYYTTLPATSAAKMGDIGAQFVGTNSTNLFIALGSGTATTSPIMTSYVAPVGTITYSADSTGFEAWRAMGSGTWYVVTSPPFYVTWENEFSIVFNEVYLESKSYLTGPQDFTVQGSADGSTWTVLATFSDAVPLVSGTHYYFDNTTAYKFWKLNITDTVGDVGIGVKALNYYGNIYQWSPLTPSTGLTATYTLPWDFGVSSWTLGVVNGGIASVTTP